MLSTLMPIVLISSVTSYRLNSFHWRSCLNDSHCQPPFTCWNNRCSCPVGTTWNPPFCEHFSFSKCPNSTWCQDTDDNRICDSRSKRCVCRDRTVEDPSDKLCKLTYDSCKSDDDCQDNFFCNQTEARCNCLFGFYFDFDDKKCRPKLKYNDLCHFHYQCSDGFYCRRNNFFGFCRCPIGQRWSESEKVCYLKANNSEANRWQACYLDSECRPNMTCESQGIDGYCQCDYGYQWSNKNKKCLLFNDTQCQDDWECKDKDLKLICKNQTCTCNDRNLEIVNGKCQGKMTACNSNADCPVLNSFCNQDQRPNFCTCRQDSHLSKYFTHCSLKRCNANKACHSDDYSNNDYMVCKSDGYCYCKYNVDKTGRCFDNKLPNVIILVFIIFGFIALFYYGCQCRKCYQKGKAKKKNKMVTIKTTVERSRCKVCDEKTRQLKNVSSKGTQCDDLMDDQPRKYNKLIENQLPDYDQMINPN